MGTMADYGGKMGAGEHVVRVVDRSNLRTRKGTDIPQVSYKMENEAGDTVWENCTLQKKFMFVLKRLLVAQGWDPKTVPDPMENPHAFDWDVLINDRPFGVEVKQDGEFFNVRRAWRLNEQEPLRGWPQPAQPEPTPQPLATGITVNAEGSVPLPPAPEEPPDETTPYVSEDNDNGTDDDLPF
jgi:hypothetical protein